MAANDWLAIRQVDPPHTEPRLLEFFGLRPPLEPADVADRVSTKRRHWTKHKSSSSKEARDRVALILANIESYGNALLTGSSTADSKVVEDLPDAVPQTTLVPETLLPVIDQWLIRDKIDVALRDAEAVRRSHPDAWQPAAALAKILLRRMDGGAVIGGGDIDRAVDDLVAAERRHPGTTEVWTLAADLMYEGSLRESAPVVRTARLERLLKLTSEAAAALRAVPPTIHANAALAQLALGQVDAGLVTAVKAIAQSPEDRDLRSTLSRGLIAKGAAPLLPIGSAQDADRFATIVATAAWIADGVPDAEEAVRPYRLWAVKCRTRLFYGSPALRGTFGFMTVFLWTLVHNRIRSMPAWQMLADGHDLDSNDMSLPGNLLRSSGDVRLVHRLAGRPFQGW